jgi:hypothetical protein
LEAFADCFQKLFKRFKEFIQLFWLKIKIFPWIFIFFTPGREPYCWTSCLLMTYRGVYYAASFND